MCTWQKHKCFIKFHTHDVSTSFKSHDIINNNNIVFQQKERITDILDVLDYCSQNCTFGIFCFKHTNFKLF